MRTFENVEVERYMIDSRRILIALGHEGPFMLVFDTLWADRAPTTRTLYRPISTLDPVR